MFYVAEGELTKAEGRWEDSSFEEHVREFASITEAHEYFDSVDPKDIYDTEVAAGRINSVGFGYYVRLIEGGEDVDWWIVDVLNEKRYTSDDVVEG